MNLSVHSFVAHICLQQSLLCSLITFISIICYNEISYVEEFNKPSFTVVPQHSSLFPHFFFLARAEFNQQKGKMKLCLSNDIGDVRYSEIVVSFLVKCTFAHVAPVTSKESHARWNSKTHGDAINDVRCRLRLKCH